MGGQAKAAKLAKKDPGYYKKSWCGSLRLHCLTLTTNRVRVGRPALGARSRQVSGRADALWGA